MLRQVHNGLLVFPHSGISFTDFRSPNPTRISSLVSSHVPVLGDPYPYNNTCDGTEDMTKNLTEDLCTEWQKIGKFALQE